MSKINYYYFIFSGCIDTTVLLRGIKRNILRVPGTIYLLDIGRFQTFSKKEKRLVMGDWS